MNGEKKQGSSTIRQWIFGGAVLAVLLAVFFGGKNRASEGDSPKASAHAGSILADNSLNTSSSHFSSDGNAFFTRRIAVANLTDHKISNEVAEALAEALRRQSYVETVDVFQADKRPVDGQQLYDLYVSVEMPEFSSKGLLLTGRKVKAELKLTVGGGFWNSRNNYHDELSPPSINLHMEATLEHSSKARGVELPGNPYRQVVANISTQLCDSVTKSLGELSAKFGDLDQIPEGLVAEFRPTPPLPLPKTEVLNQVLSGYGFMLNNYTVWTMESAETRNVLTELIEGLKAGGWDTGSPDLDDEQLRYYFRAKKDNLVLEGFEARGYEPRQEGERTRLVFRYSDRMSKEKLCGILEQIVQAEPVPIETWQAFSERMSQEQNDRVIRKIEGRSDLPASAELRVVRFLSRNRRKEEALQRLHKAAFLSRLDDEADQDQIKKLGKEITGSKDWKPAEPSVEDLERFGIRKSVPGESFEVEVGLDQPVLLYAETNDRICITSVQIERAKIPEGVFSLRTAECTIPDRGRTSSSSTPHITSRPWKAETGNHMGDVYWNISVEETDSERFLLKLKSNPS